MVHPCGTASQSDTRNCFVLKSYVNVDEEGEEGESCDGSGVSSPPTGIPCADSATPIHAVPLPVVVQHDDEEEEEEEEREMGYA